MSARFACLSLTHGPDATLVGFDDEAAEIRWIVEHVRALADEDGTLTHCCVQLRPRELRDRYAKAIAETGLELVTLDTRADDQTVPGIRAMNMHRVKGLEFRHVVIAAMNHDVMPNRPAAGGSEDLTESRDRELADLLGDIRSVKIQLPDFRRGWVRDDDHVRDLRVGIVRSFPICAVMLLETGGS